MSYTGCKRKHTPIVSRAQRRKFGALVHQGKMSKRMFLRHVRKVKGKTLPERVWRKRRKRRTFNA